MEDFGEVGGTVEEKEAATAREDGDGGAGGAEVVM